MKLKFFECRNAKKNKKIKNKKKINGDAQNSVIKIDSNESKNTLHLVYLSEENWKYFRTLADFQPIPVIFDFKVYV